MKRSAALTCLILILMVLAACSPTEVTDTAGELTITMVKANLTLPTETGALYMMITNGTAEDERLIGASVPGCATIEFHEMKIEDEVMVMQPVEGGEIVIPAGETVELKQGGLHIMCIGKAGDYAVGDTVPVSLEFANAGPMEVPAEVIAPGEMQMDND